MTGAKIIHGIGVILLDYDGSPEYNECAYHSFRNFSQGLSTVGILAWYRLLI